MEYLTPENVQTAFWISMGVGAVIGLVRLKIIPIIMVIVSLVTLHYATREEEQASPVGFNLAPPASAKASGTPYSHTTAKDVAMDAIHRSERVNLKENPSSRQNLYKHIYTRRAAKH